MKICYTHSEAESLMSPEVMRIIDLVRDFLEEYYETPKYDGGWDYTLPEIRDFLRNKLDDFISKENLPFDVNFFRGSYAVLLKHKKNKCFIKVGGITDVKESNQKIIPSPEFAIQTCFVFIDDFPIRIQPVADCAGDTRDEVYNEFKKVLKELNVAHQREDLFYSFDDYQWHFGQDFANRNVGRYQGKPVIVDW